jgi:predicted metal-dependent phosphotriesterase family hydrolase
MWSDAGEHIGPLSTQIQCYKRLGFCEVANAFSSFGDANVSLDTFDILRWDNREIIAVDSSAICIVNNLRVDLIAKRVTLSSSDKGVAKDQFCKDSDKLSTAVLWGNEDIRKHLIDRLKSKE